jgi:hypothetical protein
MSVTVPGVITKGAEAAMALRVSITTVERMILRG